TAVYAVTGAVNLNTTGGDLTITSAGGIDFGAGALHATGGSVLLTAGPQAVTVKTVTATGNVESTGAGTFELVTGGVIAATGDVAIDHVGAVTFRGPVFGQSISIHSDATSANAVFAATSAAILAT